MILDTEKAHVDLATEEVGAHVGPIFEKPITNLDANCESQITSTNQEKVNSFIHYKKSQSELTQNQLFSVGFNRLRKTTLK